MLTCCIHIDHQASPCSNTNRNPSQYVTLANRAQPLVSSHLALVRHRCSVALDANRTSVLTSSVYGKLASDDDRHGTCICGFSRTTMYPKIVAAKSIATTMMNIHMPMRAARSLRIESSNGSLFGRVIMAAPIRPSSEARRFRWFPYGFRPGLNLATGAPGAFASSVSCATGGLPVY